MNFVDTKISVMAQVSRQAAARASRAALERLR